ncbi:peptidoglycan-binding protein [Candidatus Wolfebacteria bacterium]|nr:peptidoglycan-binding protein [Candidatus Wolfebacteria bacterium]
MIKTTNFILVVILASGIFSQSGLINSNNVWAQTAASPDFCYNWQKNLTYGMTDDLDVKALQIALTKERQYSGPITGNFYELTKEAVKNFQKEYGISAVGAVGPITRAKLNELYSCAGAGGGSSVSSSASSSPYKFAKDLTIGAQGDDVILLQQLLIAEGYLKIPAPTGYFGSFTKDALSKYQIDKGIDPASGVLDIATREYMATHYTGLATSPASIPATSTPPNSTTTIMVKLKAGAFDSAQTLKIGATTTLNWTSSNATSCEAFGDWSGTKPVSGTEPIEKLKKSNFYVLTCIGATGSSSDSVSVYTYSDAANTLGGANNPITPKIDTIMPPVVDNGAPVRVTGSGFAPRGNKIITSYGTYFKDIKSDDGKTLYFPATCPTTGTTYPMDVTIENENGKSNKKTILCKTGA